jgi:N-methylhydantoinase A
MRYLLAADTGGTFTDIVVFDQRTKATQFGKTLSNCRDLVAGVLGWLVRMSEAGLTKGGFYAHFR